ncbi:hypothetical protein ACFPN2_35780 [Steroidobacter flavus]|uniref:Uncharacterized protein n=1 Tax=Steroidobacter flavus TaxID=1842136 RepID=A0ABV8T3X4_9GAMM
MLRTLALRTLLFVTYVPLAATTLQAYAILSFNIVVTLQGSLSNPWIGGCVVLASLAGLYGVWRIWSIGKRLWIHSTYVPPEQGGRAKDGYGLLAGWLAFVAMAALTFIESSARLMSVQFLGSLFTLPAAIVATAAFAWSPARLHITQ